MPTRKQQRARARKPAPKPKRPSKKPAARKSKAPPRPRGRTSAAAERRALDALRRMRHGVSLTRAARTAHVSPATVKRYERGVVKRRKRRYVAEPYDRQLRQLKFLAPDGLVLLDIRDSRVASRIAQFWAAVDHYLRTGDTSRLRPFVGKTVRSGGARYGFITDPTTIERLANVGLVTFEDLYNDHI